MGNDEKTKENGYFKGKVDAKFEFNDKEHQVLFDKLKEIDEKMITRREASIWGLMGGMVASIGAYLATLFLGSHLKP